MTNVGHRKRTDIQFLRALAVAAVVLFHAWPGNFTGGFAGVDIFFVISGFLITGILVDGMERAQVGRFVIDFFSRRVRRLVPLAALVIVATAVASRLILPGFEWRDQGRYAWASALYFQNWRLIGDSAEYVTQDQGASPFQHFWSLSVEEQFYLAWPIVLLIGLFLGRKRIRSYATWVMLVVSAASFGFALGWAPDNAGAAYYSTFTRAWEFGAGGLCALLPIALTRVTREWMRIAGILLCAGSVFLIRTESGFPGWVTLLPVLGAALLVASGSTPDGAGGVAARVLAWKPFQVLGDASYGIYLWHWPLIVLLPLVIGTNAAWVMTVAIAASVVLAIASRPYEVWWQRAPVLSKKLVPAAIIAGLVVATSAGLAGGAGALLANGAPAKVTKQNEVAPVVAVGPCVGAAAFAPGAKCTKVSPDAVQPAPDTARQDQPYENCKVSLTGREVKTCSFGNGKIPVALVGDSHAQRWIPGLIPLLAKNDWKLTTYLKSSCVFSAVTPIKYASSCGAWNQEAATDLKQGRYKVVMVAGAAGIRFKAEQGRTDVEVGARGYGEQWKPLIDGGAKVVALRDNPQMGFARVDPPACVIAKGPSQCAAPQDKALLPDPAVTAVPKVDGSALVDLTSFFCRAQKCPSVIGGVLVYRDGQHVLSAYAKTLSPYLGAALTAALKRA